MSGRETELRSRLLREAFARRLDVVRIACERSSSAPRAREPSPPVGARDPEETLLDIMIRLVPAARARGEQAAVDALREQLRALRYAARTADLRFVDAWNAAYEAAFIAFDRALLCEYIDLLEWHVERLRVK